MAVRLLVVDDHEIVRSGVVSMLADTDIEVVGEAADGTQAITAADLLKPDVVIIDVWMPHADGFEVIAGIQKCSPNSKILILSSSDNPTYVARAHTLGVADYLLKGADRETIVNTVAAVARGESPTPYGELQKVANTMATQERLSDPSVALTQREVQVLRHLALGLSNKDISNSLTISIETVKEHVQHLLRKMGANDRTQAAVWAVKHGLAD